MVRSRSQPLKARAETQPVYHYAKSPLAKPVVWKTNAHGPYARPLSCRLFAAVVLTGWAEAQPTTQLV
jgi:hypothetical protein